MKYKLITVEDSFYSFAQEKLENEVNALLKEGWRLQGGVSVSTYVEGNYDTNYVMSQAMVLEEDKPAPTSEFHVSMM
ncbi:MAG: DUF1737 domain-containing protein [Clostridia bacterium]|nr:DUF1737 domain-containing protein [Clostridia bacterium]